MKKYIYYLTIVFALALNSCGEFNGKIYNGDIDNDQTLAYFDGSQGTIEVVLGSEGSITVPVGVSTLSESDRTLTITVTDNTTASSSQYEVVSSVTIPAGSYTSSFTVKGFDADNLSTTGVNLELGIESSSDFVASPEKYSVKIVKICPIDGSLFVGDYILTTNSGGIPAAGFAPAMGDNLTVTLQQGTSSTERTFNVKFYPTFGFSNPPVDVSFSLSCEETVFNGIVSPGVSGVGCGGSIPFGRSGTNGVYDTTDDSVVTLFYLEDVGGASCGDEVEGSITLTKI